MLYLNVKGTDPYSNLALEEFVMNALPKGESAFLLWQNANAVVVGQYQSTREEVSTAYAQQHEIQIARRITGGGAVYHDLGNVNFSFICDCAEHERLDFFAFSEIMANALRKLGIDAQISGRNDLLAGGRKFSGSAQTVRNGRVLHHGTLLFQTDLERMQHVLTVDQEKLLSKGVASVRSRVVNLAELLDDKTDIIEFKNRLLETITNNHLAKEMSLKTKDWDEIRRLRDEKYNRQEWIYGRSPGYTVRKSFRFPTGKVELLLDAKKGDVIDSISIRGDFFGIKDIRKLEQRLGGVALCAEQLRFALNGVAVGQYISGVSAEELIGLILS